MKTEKRKIILGVTGASGTVYGVRALEILRDLPDIETHLIVSKSAEMTLGLETDYKLSDVTALADYAYSAKHIGAAIASGSFKTHGMLIAPCSIKTMSEIAGGVTGNLIARAADVCLKERRKLVLAVRETPFHLGHLRNMTQLAEIGAIIAPPVPSFYDKPQNLDAMITQTVLRWLSLLDISDTRLKVWDGKKTL